MSAMTTDELRERDARLEDYDALRAERDRLRRVIAVERGDESQAPEGWRRDSIHWARHRWRVKAVRLGHDLKWIGYLDGVEVVRALSALEAMEAADAAREVADD